MTRRILGMILFCVVCFQAFSGQKGGSLAFKSEADSARTDKLQKGSPELYYKLAAEEFGVGDMKQTAIALRKVFTASRKAREFTFRIKALGLMARVDSSLGLLDSAIGFSQAYVGLKDSLNNAELYNRIEQMQTQFDLGKKDNQIKLFGKDKDLAEAKLHRQVIVSRIVTGALLIFSLLAIVLLRNFLAKRKANKILQLQKTELDEKRKQLADKKEKIEESIRYAQRIQEAVLPAALFLEGEVQDYFTLYQPKDMVSGDFYWRFRQEDALYFTVADCTGHGVPGAMMSMLGYDMLEHAVKEKGLREPAEILNELNAYIIEKLFKDNSDGAKDGMDLTLCKLNLITRELFVAGARNELRVVSGGLLREYAVDKHPIGYNAETKYTQQKIVLSANDMVYLSTDGYADQKGGPDAKKFGRARFNALITEASGMDTGGQKAMLEEEFVRWKGKYAQRDDILIAGFRCM